MTEDPAIYELTSVGRSDRKVDGPASDELQRARELAACLAFAIRQANMQKRYQVSLSIEEAEELCQLLHDSIRTADQLAGKVGGR